MDYNDEIFSIIAQEEQRQREGLEMIASENFTSMNVRKALGSCLTNKYSEGLPGRRYYGGNEYIDKIETECQKRALNAFRLNPEEWAVNVQPLSGAPANFAVYAALLEPHDRIMGLDLPSGGHLTHGFYIFDNKNRCKKPISMTSKFFESYPYTIDPQTQLIDYDGLEKIATVFCPKLIICGGSAYPREWDYARFRQIANKIGAYLMMDMAHISGLIATEHAMDPFPYCDIVTTTTHKTLRGPRSGMIFMRKEYENAINAAVFPGLQGGPHEHQIAGVAVQLREVMTVEFREYIAQTVKNAKSLASALLGYGYTLSTGGTDNHLILWDLRPQGLSGSKLEKICEEVGISLNKNTVVGDKSSLSPGGVRIGSPALTTRGLKEPHFEHIATYLHRCVQIALDIQQEHGKLLKDFNNGVHKNKELSVLREEIRNFALQFPMPGDL